MSDPEQASEQRSASPLLGQLSLWGEVTAGGEYFLKHQKLRIFLSLVPNEISDVQVIKYLT